MCGYAHSNSGFNCKIALCNVRLKRKENSMSNPYPPQSTIPSINRRHFLKYSSLAFGAAALGGPYILRGQNLNSKLNVAVIGAGGKGSSDTDNVAELGENIYALCDIDGGTLEARTASNAPASGGANNRRQGRTYPSALKFRDYRQMLEKIGDKIDAVTVSTPDHHHAIAAAMAMKMGKHVYVQKPLTHSVFEARTLRRLAKEMKVATQMGNQGSAGSGLRRAVEVIQAGVIGKPLELHVWSNRPIWPQGIDRPAGQDPVPDNVDWDLWVGPAPMRPYKKGVYHTFAWRGWKDFGTGALGDMACHTVNMPFRALKLGYPNVIECEETSEMHAETYPKTSRIRFEFPAREGLPPLKFWWYDGSPDDKSIKALRPHADITKEIVALRTALPPSGCLVIGDKGKVFSPDDYGSQFFLLADNETKFTAGNLHEACKAVPQTIPRNEGPGGGDQMQKAEWIRMIKGGAPAYSNFDIAAYLAEVILLGCVAMRVGVGKKLDWDGPNMKATNAPEAAQYVKREYRAGWKI